MGGSPRERSLRPSERVCRDCAGCCIHPHWRLRDWPRDSLAHAVRHCLRMWVGLLLIRWGCEVAGIPRAGLRNRRWLCCMLMLMTVCLVDIALQSRRH